MIGSKFNRIVLAEPARAAALLVRLYQLFLSPLKRLLLGPYAGCRFYPSCSQYARESLRRHGFVGGCTLAVRRIFRCHPFHPGGFDPVPATPRCVGRRIRKMPEDSVDRGGQGSAGTLTHG